MTNGIRTAVCALVLAVTGIGASRLPVSAQATRTDDLLPALLVEMKGLRVATEQMASGSPQAQLLAARLQVQESRLTTMIDRLDMVHDRLEIARAEYDTTRESLQELERKDPPGPGLQHATWEDEVQGTKASLASDKARLERLIAEEMQLAADVTSEQQRWIAINQRLDDLERTLAKR